MNDASVYARMDKELKNQAEAVFEEIGLSASAAIKLFYKQVVLTRSIPFSLRADPVLAPPELVNLTPEQISAKLEKSFAQRDAGLGRPANEVFDEMEQEFRRAYGL